jgi:hypothetical protein
LEQRFGHSGSLDKPENKDKNDCPDSGNNNASKQAPACGDAKKAKKKSSEHGSQYSNNNVSNYAEAAALHEHSCQPSRNQSDQNEPNDFHDFLLLLSGVRRFITVVKMANALNKLQQKVELTGSPISFQYAHFGKPWSVPDCSQLRS